MAASSSGSCGVADVSSSLFSASFSTPRKRPISEKLRLRLCAGGIFSGVSIRLSSLD